MKTIEYDENVDYTVAHYPEDYVRTLFRFTMHQVLLSSLFFFLQFALSSLLLIPLNKYTNLILIKGAITLSTQFNPMLELSFAGFSIANKSRPGSLSSTIEIQLDKILVHDHFTPHTAFGIISSSIVSYQYTSYECYFLIMRMFSITFKHSSSLISVLSRLAFIFLIKCSSN